MNGNEPWIIAECPSDLDLARFSTGRLDGGTFEQLSEHVTICAICSRRLSDIESNDSVIDELQRYVPKRSGAAERPLGQSLGGRIGEFEILGELGRGGMGVVYKALQPGLNRIVALKTVTAMLLDEAEAKTRFKLEAEAIGRLQHANIVHVHSSGEVGGIPYLCMEYVEGPTLSAALRAKPLSSSEIAETLLSIARAVAYSHSRKVLHRDLKPANVLIGKQGAKLTDFGLAKLADLETGHSRADRVVGTASYMAPEQADRSHREIGEHTDIYGLGAILYEMLTGVPPFKGATREETLQMVRGSLPARPREVQKSADRGLEAICLKCLEKEPADRYASAEEVVEELRRWQRGVPVRALSRRRRLTHPRVVRRSAVAAAIVGLVALASLGIYSRSSAYAIGQMQRQLRAGHAVELLDREGRPKFERLALGNFATSVETAPNGVYRVSTWDTCIIELLPDPIVSSYILTAEVQHSKSDVPGEVGLIVGYYHSESRANEHQMIQLSYNDIRGSKDLMEAIPMRLRGPPFPNFACLFPHGLRTLPIGVVNHRAAGEGLGLPFEPAGFRGGPWRQLKIEVTPDFVRGSWQGKQTEPLTWMKAEESLSSLAEASILPNRLKHRGGVGLYISRGSASFRNIRLIPR